MLLKHILILLFYFQVIIIKYKNILRTMWYDDLKIRNVEGKTINFTDWQKQTIYTLNEHKNIKKVWLVNKQRKTGATYFSKLLLFFRQPCTDTFVISNNLDWSKDINKQMPIEFLNPYTTKDGEWYKASNFLTPVTLYGLEKEIVKDQERLENLADIKEFYFGSRPSYTPSFECLYDNDFNINTYNVLCSYNFDFFIINVSQKDLEAARPFIEADKDKEDVLIVNIEDQLLPNN